MAQLTMKPVWHDKLTLIEYTDPVEGGVEGIDNKPHIELAENSAYLKQQLDKLDKKADSLEEMLDEQETKLDDTAEAINGGITNDDGTVTLKSLLERIKELESNANKIPIGTFIASKKHYKTGGDFAQNMGYGVWERALEGRVPVGFSDIVSDPEVFRTAGAEYGEFEHTLTIEEIPTHKHSTNDIFDKFVARYDDYKNSEYQDGSSANTANGFTDDHSSNEAVTSHEGNWEDLTEQLQGGGQAHNNLQPSRTIDWWERVA